VQLKQEPGSVLQFMSALSRAPAPGTIWNYNTGETFVGRSCSRSRNRQATGDLSSEKTWVPWGMEQDASWCLESQNGMGLGGGGRLATLRDYGHFGLFVVNDGVINGKGIVPRGWFDGAGSAQIAGKPVDDGYMWWPLPAGFPIHDDVFEARGIFGQLMYLNRKDGNCRHECASRANGDERDSR
jgi:CubicO group peptidase (beta-lactamase class C family)